MSFRHTRFLLPALVALVVAATATLAATASGTPPPTPRIAVMIDRGGCNDATTLRLCDGFRSAIRRAGIGGQLVTPTYAEQAADMLALIARQHYEAVILFGLWYDPAIAATMRRFPKTRFTVLDGSWRDLPSRPTNVQGIVFRSSEAAFLAGWLAGKLEQRRPGRDVVGVVGGIPVPAVQEFVIGFAAGARRASPGIAVLKSFSYDWVDQSKCESLARRQIARGAGTVFNVAGSCGLGTLKAAKAAGVWGVGVDSDQSFLGPHILTSVLKHFDAGFTAVIRQVQANRLATGRDTILTMRDGAVGLGTISPKVPASLVEQVEALSRKIVAGKVRVPGAVPRKAA